MVGTSNIQRHFEADGSVPRASLMTEVAEAPNQKQQVPESDEEIRLAHINCFCTAAISIVMNMAVLFVARKPRDNLRLMSNAPMMTYTSCIAIAFSVTHALSCPMVHIHASELLIINNGILQHQYLGRVALCIFVFFVLYSALISAILLAAKCLMLCRMYVIEGKKFHAFCGIPLLLSLLWTFVFAYTVWLSSSTSNGMHGHPLRQRPAIYTARENAFFAPLLSILVGLLLCAFASMIYSAISISSRISTMTDQNSKERHTKIFRLVLMQASLPFLLLHLPILISFILDQWLPMIISDNLAVTYAWYPALVPVVVYWNVKERFTMCCRYRPRNITSLSMRRSTR